MYSTELIRKFPDNPEKQILYVVYSKEMVWEAKALIGTIHGVDYADNHVTVIPFSEKHDDMNLRDYSIYIDPTVFTYKHSWND